MSDITDRLAGLSPEKRALLTMRLKKKRAGSADKQAITRRADGDSYPISFAQQRLWFLDQFEPNSSFYNVPTAIRLTGPLEVDALEQSLNEVISRHEVLRATFSTENGSPVQIIHPEMILKLPVADLRHLPETEREAEVLRLATMEAQRPFDLGRGPLVRSGLLWIDEEEYIVLLTIHHIAFDGWSTGVLVQEVAALYEAITHRLPPPLADLPIQYADYSSWQRLSLQGEVLDAQLSYWKDRLGDRPSILELPTDRPHPPVQTYRGAYYKFEISRDLTNRLKSLSRQEDVTLYITLLAAFQTLLYRYTGQTDICVGSPIANRNRREIEGLIGLFTNMLVMRSDLSGDPDFRKLLHKVREVALGAQAHQEIPFEMLVDELQVERNMSHSPLFQVALVYQNAPMGDLKLGDMTMSIIETDVGTVKLDLSLVIEEGENTLTGTFRYNTDLFDRTTIVRMLEHLHSLMEAIVTDPDQRISELPLMRDTEKERLLEQWNDTGKDYPQFQNVVQLFEAQVEKTPGAIAIHFPTPGGMDQAQEHLTYFELNSRANKLAHFLQNMGVGPETLVGIYVERSIEMIVGLLGVLKAGGAYVPLKPNYPQERLAFMLKDTQLPVLLTQERLKERLPENQARMIILDTDWNLIDTESDENLSHSASQENLAYIIYTSGSTGLSKGVLVKQRGLINHAQSMVSAYDLGPGDRVLQFITLSFDASGEEIYPALLSGATLVLIRSAEELVGGRLIEFCEAQEINVLHLPATVWHQAVDDVVKNGDPIQFPLKVLIVGGEIPDIDRMISWSRLIDHPMRFINAYGPTEATITSIHYETVFDVAVIKSMSKVPVGRPIPNVKVYILDDQFQPVPVGVLGELYIGGAGVARGYLNRPELTIERFVSDPFSENPGARLYKTGDLARYLPDGNVEFIGRADYQVKIRGFRIELGEIEAALRSHSKIQDVVVIAREETPGNKHLIAYIVLKESGLAVSEVGDFLRAKLPEYMVPSVFMYIEGIPLLANGKVDRRALPIPDDERLALKKIYTAPRNTLEEYLADMWQELLGVQQIGVHDNFFELGGNSILGATFVNKLQDEMGEYIYLIAIFDAPTISKLALYLNKDYPIGVYRITGTEPPDGILVREQGLVEKVDDEDVENLRELIVTLPPRADAEGSKEKKNRQAAFILSAPRSGSTLLRVMLGGSPLLFAPPELQLLNFNTLEDQQAAFALERDAFWLDGTYQAIMAVKDCDLDDAKQIMQSYRDQKLTVKQFYGVIQGWLGDRLFIDKTPNYSLDIGILKRAEEDFENPLYIHLVRHPYAIIPSFEKARLQVFYPPFFKDDHAFSTKELAELVWVISHQNILEFLSDIPADRQYRVFYEDIVSRPQEIMAEISRFLNVEYHPDMLEPQKDPQVRMTDAIHPLAKMVGDVRFFEHKGIDAANANRWKETLQVDYLGEVSWGLAESFGYERTEVEQLQRTPKVKDAQELEPIQPVQRAGELPLSFAQQRLWFLDHLEEGSPYYNIPLAVRLIGPLNVTALQRSLNEIIRRHEVLRSKFPTEDGIARLEIAPDVQLTPSIIDLSDLPADKCMQEVYRQVALNAQQPFDLAKGLLLRVNLLRIEKNDHVAVLVMHHIISDGWSMGVFIRELAALYQSFINDIPSPLPDLSIQYVDYANWQRGWLSGELLERQLNYWRGQLAGSQPLIELPTDRPRPSVQTSHGGRRIFSLTRELTEALNNLSQVSEDTLYMTLLSAFSTLLYRYTDQDDINIGTPIAYRNRAELEGLIGFFVNTLVLRTDLSGNPSFRTLLRRVRKTTIEAFAHQDVPFEMLVDEIQPDRDMSHTPLFQVMFVMQNAPVERLELPDLTICPLEADSGTAKFDLTLSFIEREGELNGVLEYNSDLFDHTSIERMINHFQVLLDGIVADPDQPVDALPLMLPDEEKRLLGEWNETSSAFPDDTCVHYLIEKQIEKNPHATAIKFENQTLTYGEINSRANQLAHHLRSKGVGPETLVGLCVERSPEMVVGILGILKAGGAYLPLDPAYPTERLDYLLQETRAPVLLTQEPLLVHLSLHSENGKDRCAQHVICLDSDWGKIALESNENPEHIVSPTNIAYVIFTSGSTGKPKGTLVPHRGLCNLVENVITSRSVTSESRVLQSLSFSFDASTIEFFPTLASGAMLYLTTRENVMSLPELHPLMQDEAITHIMMTPSMLSVIPSSDLPALQSITCGGEACTIAVVEKWATDRLFHNAYGPTEATVEAAYYLIRDRFEGGSSIPIGRACHNVRLYILNKQLKPVPIGVPGELYIGGVGVTRGYLRRPELTAEQFIPDAFTSQPGERLYKTGDLARFQADRNIEFLGRIDYQVKVRGFRIELGEIESVLVQHPGLKDVIIQAREDTPGVKRLVAYVVPNATPAPVISDLRAYLEGKLPDYMVPSYFIVLDELPLTPNGKYDLRALPAPDQERPDLIGKYVAPRTEEEMILVDIWSQVLGLKRIGVYDNFFELGGDSILSIQVIARANQSGLRLTPKQLFRYPTIEGLASVADSAPVIQAEQGIVEGDFPLTPIQRWFFDMELPEPNHWNQSILVEVRQPLEQDLLRKTVQHLLMHHDALRLRFDRRHLQWSVFNAGIDDRTPLEWVDLSLLPNKEAVHTIEAHASEVQASLNLTDGQIFRMIYYSLGKENSDRLLMVMHHLVIDGVSWRILMDDFQSIYQQLVTKKDVQLPLKTTSYKYWSEKLVEYATSRASLNELDYWTELSGKARTSLPLDYPGGENTETSGQLIQKELNVAETQSLLHDVPTAYGTEINDALLMALVKTISDWTGSRSHFVDLEGHGREDIFEDVDISRTVGWFTSIFPVYLQLVDENEPGQALIQVKEQLRKMPNRGIGYGLLCYLCDDKTVHERLIDQPRPEISFNYLGQVDQSLPENSPFSLAPESKGTERSKSGDRMYSLIISGNISQGRLQMNWSYSSNMYRSETIDRLAEQFMQELRELIQHCLMLDAVSYTPSDFEDVNLDQDEIDDLLEEIGGF